MLGPKIKLMLKEGRTNREIRTVLNCSKGIIAFHAKRIGLENAFVEYDWALIQKQHDSGKRCADLIKEHGFSGSTWTNAIRKGKLIARPRCPAQPVENWLIENSPHNRTSIKRKLLKAGLLINKCYECGSDPSWNGKMLVLQIDHKNGKRLDYRLTNLQLLCPNCHSQTVNFAGRNK